MEAVPTSGLICGVDEAGRGPLAGAVVAAAVVLDPARPVDGLNDSKKLTERARERLAVLIRERAVAWAVAEASVEEIDRLNILHATMLAMQRAVAALSCVPDLVRVDGNRCPPLSVPSEAVVGGDGIVPAIAAASILAKTTRDAQMIALDAVFPAYGFASHKGYATREHFTALRRHGVVDCHRRSFAPVRELLDNPELWAAGTLL
ncbi:ribonuclease HII [Aromatoleum sp.]|uniref:ribonuclease HII n=1 Tax=Aromatoleum sp. TaxID=2307007 RepID=UPI002FC62FA6